MNTNPETDTRTQRERMLAGDLYIFNDPELQERNTRAIVKALEYGRVWPEDRARGQEILTDLLGEVGEEVFIVPPLQVDYGSQISIGARSFANYNLVALDVAPITIGEDCQIGPNVQLLTPTHPVDPELRRQKYESAQPITIGNNVWIGGGAIVLPGVTIGDNCVIGAGAVVTKSLPANVIALGNPARVVREI
jgi:maltose O-acetyltransferase